MLLLLLACDPSADSKPDQDSSPLDSSPLDSSPLDSSPLDSSCTEPTPPSERAEGAAPVAARNLSGTITWSLDFDTSLEAEGYQDCSYTREYSGIERIDQGYLCPTCTVLVPAAAEMIAGYEDCYLQIDDADRTRTEMVGVGTDETGAPGFFRSGAVNLAPAWMGPAVEVGDVEAGDTVEVSWASDNSFDTGGTYALSAIGTLLFTESATLVEDPLDSRTEPYTCGWPLQDPGGDVTYPEDFLVEDGEIFPVARFEDQCEERVSLRDFRGYYTVIDISAANCGPCQQMAERADAFEAKLENDCIPVAMVTLLAESLSTINVPADLALRQDWANTFGLSSPVLGDEGFGYALLPLYMGYDSMSYPTTIVLDPDGKLIGGFGGFGVDVDGNGNEIGSTFDDIEALIRSN